MVGDMPSDNEQSEDVQTPNLSVKKRKRDKLVAEDGGQRRWNSSALNFPNDGIANRMTNDSTDNGQSTECTSSPYRFTNSPNEFTTSFPTASSDNNSFFLENNSNQFSPSYFSFDAAQNNNLNLNDMQKIQSCVKQTSIRVDNENVNVAKSSKEQSTPFFGQDK
jgi:hypothetical protein